MNSRFGLVIVLVVVAGIGVTAFFMLKRDHWQVLYSIPIVNQVQTSRMLGSQNECMIQLEAIRIRETARHPSDLRCGKNCEVVEGEYKCDEIVRP